jgi:hypothetical protein
MVEGERCVADSAAAREDNRTSYVEDTEHIVAVMCSIGEELHAAAMTTLPLTTIHLTFSVSQLALVDQPFCVFGRTIDIPVKANAPSCTAAD